MALSSFNIGWDLLAHEIVAHVEMAPVSPQKSNDYLSGLVWVDLYT